MNLSHYKLPDGNVQISFSGGRTSAYMLHQILEANGGLPDRAKVHFANTGREMPETLDFVNEVASRFGVHVNWLEYSPNPPGYTVVSHNSASRDGLPFEAMIVKKQALPNNFRRFCTIELKIRTAKKFYMNEFGWKEWTSAIGIRADEPKRFRPENDKGKDRWFVWQPLYHAGVSRHDVRAFWEAQPFDLRLPNVNGTTPLGNCDGCFLKSEKNRAALAREFPERYQWWVDMEHLAKDLVKNRNRRWQPNFLDGTTYEELASFVDRQGDWIFDDVDVLCQADGGECFGE